MSAEAQGHEAENWTNKQALKWAGARFRPDGVKKVEGKDQLYIQRCVNGSCKAIPVTGCGGL
jgi:hypothetical protein